MKTIKTKLFVLFVVFMVTLVVCGVMLNALFLEQYYIYKNKSIFSETSKQISEQYRLDKKKIENTIGSIDRMEGISCTIADKNLKVLYNSFPQKEGPDANLLPNEIERIILAERASLNDANIYTLIENSKDQAAKLVFISQMDTGELIILKKPLKGISESVLIANQFYVIAGLIMILIGGMVVFVFSRRITRPLVEMSSVAEDISNLGFERRVTIDSQDEIGSLGRSINRIAERLSANISALKTDVDRRKSLVRNMSHELKTPIGVIKGYAEGLKFGVVEDPEKTRQYCSVISEECDRMDAMVQELLNLSMLEAGLFQAGISRFSLSALLGSITERLEPAIKKKKIVYEKACGEDLFVVADSTLLERAITNYLINAINHTDGKRLVSVSAERRGDQVRIEVFNSGNPIEKQDLGHIWDVFYKADKARTRQYGGHGLGLSIVKSIAEFHKGSVGAENIRDGVLFFIEIPIIFSEAESVH